MQQLMHKYKSTILYLIFGVLTTAVNLATFAGLQLLLPGNLQVNNVLAWALSVLFAFVTNKMLVFESHDYSWRGLLNEGSRFAGARVASLLLDMMFLAVGVGLLRQNTLIVKVIDNVIVVIINYWLSKKLVFKTPGTRQA